MARTVFEELIRRIKYMEHVSFDDAPSMFTGFLNWLESEPATNAIITKLRREVDIEPLMKTAGPHQPPKASNPEEIARVGLFIFEYCREHPRNLPGLLFTIGSHVSHGNFHDHFGVAVRKYLNPFLNYLQEELRNAPSCTTVDAVVQLRRDTILSPTFEQEFPDTFRLLQNMAKEMSVFTESENWFNIANSCRETMKQFTGELLKALVVTKPEEIKAGDFKGILRHVLSLKLPAGRNRDTLETLVTAVWDYASSLLHNQKATRSEAMRAYLWTGLAISEVFEQTREQTTQP